ncbi:MAG: transposase [Deltaproteobacteria bacterium]|nr:transposase [Deltaproteobacteria bacterium]
MLLRRSYRFRVYPTREHLARIEAWEYALRWLWNFMHAEYAAKFEDGSLVPTAKQQSYTLTMLRERVPFLAELPRNVSMQLLHELDKAWQRYFARLGERPRFKSRKRGELAPMIEPHPKLFKIEGEGRDATLSFPKLGELRAIVHRALEGAPKTCALVREGDEWYCAVSCEVHVADPESNAEPAVGIDRGVVNLLADSDGRTVENPRPLQRSQGKVRKAQRKLSRTKKGSKNRARAAKRVGRIYRHVSRQRDAVLHRESKHYAENQGVVVVEALRLKNMTASAKGTVEAPGTNVAQKAGLNRALLDGGLGRFVELLKYKALATGCRVVEVDPAYSSQECAECKHLAAESRRSQSEFACVACGHRANADVNAARVLLSRGMHGGEVCGGDAVARPAKQKLRAAKRGTRALAQGAVVATTKAPCFSTG